MCVVLIFLLLLCDVSCIFCVFVDMFFFKQKTAYELRISDWSSDVCSSDLTGLGGRIDISMLESMAEWMSYPLYYSFDGASPPPRNGASHSTIYPYGPFAAGDGKTVMLGLQNEREWQVFCQTVLRDRKSTRLNSSH